MTSIVSAPRVVGVVLWTVSRIVCMVGRVVRLVYGRVMLRIGSICRLMFGGDCGGGVGWRQTDYSYKNLVVM